MIQTRHHDGDEDTAQELLEEVLGAMPVGKLKDSEVGTLRDGLHHARHVQSHPLLDLPDDDDQHPHQAKRLQRIGPDDGLDAAPEGVEPHQEDAEYHGDRKGNVPRAEDVGL